MLQLNNFSCYYFIKVNTFLLEVVCDLRLDHAYPRSSSLLCSVRAGNALGGVV